MEKQEQGEREEEASSLNKGKEEEVAEMTGLTNDHEPGDAEGESITRDINTVAGSDERETTSQTKLPNDWLQWSPEMYAFLENDIATLSGLPPYLHRYLLFQCR